MNLSKIFLLLLLSLCVSTSYAAKLTPGELETILNLVGTYSNVNGANSVVSIDNDGANLEFNINIESGDLYLDLSLSDFYKIEDDGVVIFNIIPGTCDDAGCTDYDGSLLFIPKKSGGYYMVVDVVASTNTLEADVDSSLTGDDLVKALEAFCVESYGEGTDFYGNDFWGTCEYSSITYLKNNAN